MPDTRTTIEDRAGTGAAILPTIGAVGRSADSSERRGRLAVDRALDEVLADSFPASDPPSWNPGTARPDSDRTFLQGVVSLVGATGVALLVPFAILLVGLPIALSIQGVLELFGWLFGVNIG